MSATRWKPSITQLCIASLGTVSLRGSPCLFPSRNTYVFNARARHVAGGWQTKSAVTSSPCARGAISAKRFPLARKDVGGRREEEEARCERRKEEVGYVSRPKVECWPRVISVATTRRCRLLLRVSLPISRSDHVVMMYKKVSSVSKFRDVKAREKKRENFCKKLYCEFYYFKQSKCKQIILYRDEI